MKQNYKKTVLATILTMSAVVANAYDFVFDGFYYTVTDTTNLCVEVNDAPSTADVIIPDSVYYHGIYYYITGIGSYAFAGNQILTSITVPNGVTSIGDYAFSQCTKLNSFTIPNSVTSIGSNAFYHCSKLTEVTIPNRVTTIGDYAFCECTGITSVIIEDGATNLDLGTLVFANGKYGTISYYMEKLYIGRNLTTSNYFANQTKLTSITIGDTVNSIGDNAFYGCSGLTDVIIGSGVKKIGDNAFYSCSGLTSVNIPNSVNSIGDNAFYSCSGLTSVTIPNVTTIGSYAFRQCYGLTSVTFGSGVETIGSYAFWDCYKLTNVIIGSGMKTIEDLAFRNCTKITSLTSEATTPPTCGYHALASIDKALCTLHVPSGTASLYQSTDPWWDFYNIKGDVVSAISDISVNEEGAQEVARYNLNGQRINAPQQGINIIQYSDGSVKKVYVNNHLIL